MKAKDAASRVLDHIYGHVTALKSNPPQPAKQFAAAGLMRCCALLKGIITLDEAGMSTLAGILARQHWETWLVSLYALLAGEEALQVVAGDDIYWKRRLSKALRLERDYHPDWAGQIARLNYKALSDRVLALLRERESVDGPAGVTGYDVTYAYQSLFSLHANLATIGGHLVYGDDEWAVAADSPPVTIDVAVTPVLHTVHLAQHVFRDFGLDGDAMDPLVADLVVPANTQRQNGV
jgi:hypothetical protein